MNWLLLLFIQVPKDLCEQYLIADNPFEQQEAQEELNRLRLLSPEYFRGQDETSD